ncbi:MAG: FtsH protease activity modulator HflK [bacterium]
MAWNEPGGDKDPWGGNNGEGPPDLEEAWQKFKERFGMNGGGGGQGPHWPIIGLVFVALLLVFSFLRGDPHWLFGLYQVDEKERAVVLRFGQYKNTVGPGLHWNAPLVDRIFRVDVTQERQYPSRGMMLTKDENIVELPLSVQYNIKSAEDFVLNVKDPELSLRHATDSALRHVVGSSSLDSVVSVGREQIGFEVKDRLQSYLDLYDTGIEVRKVNIQEAKPPTEVKAAYDDVIKAREDQERVVNEAEGYSNSIIPEARGRAQRMLEEANGYKEQVIAKAEGDASRFNAQLAEYKKAPEVTRERMYLEAVQDVMSNSSKVMMDVEGGNNMIYLPLDKLMENSTGGTSSTRPMTTRQLEEIVDRVVDKIGNQPSVSSRRREVR